MTAEPLIRQSEHKKRIRIITLQCSGPLKGRYRIGEGLLGIEDGPEVIPAKRVLARNFHCGSRIFCCCFVILVARLYLRTEEVCGGKIRLESDCLVKKFLRSGGILLSEAYLC